MSDIEILPCPFCNSPAEIDAAVHIEGDEISSHCALIRCTVCPASMREATLEQALAAWNTRASVTPPEPPDTEASRVRFFPTHVMTVDVGSGGGGLEGWCEQIEEIRDYPQWGAAGVLLNWDDLEPAERGEYDFTILDTLIACCKENNKGLHLGIKFQWFGGTTSPEGKLPAYLDTIEDGEPGYSLRPEGEEWAGDLSLYVHVHDERVMSCLIDLWRAVAERYASDSTLRMITFGETSIDAPSESGFTEEKLFNQVVRFAYETRRAFPETEVRVMANYLGDKPTMCELLDELDAYDVAPGGPDNYSRSYDSNLAQNGEVDGHDRRGRCAWVSENQRPAGSSGGDEASSAQITQHNNEGALEKGGSMRPHYWQWSRNYAANDPWPAIRDYVAHEINGATNTTNPHAGKKIRRAAPKHRTVRVRCPTRPGIDDAWPTP